MFCSESRRVLLGSPRRALAAAAAGARAPSATMITEAGPLNLRLGPAGVTVKLHPTVLVTVCESYIRRKAGLRRVIGTLLGNATDDAIVVKDCYAVPHEEDDEQVRLSLCAPAARGRAPLETQAAPACGRSLPRALAACCTGRAA